MGQLQRSARVVQAECDRLESAQALDQGRHAIGVDEGVPRVQRPLAGQVHAADAGAIPVDGASFIRP